MLSRLKRLTHRVRRSALAFPLAALVAAGMLLISEIAYQGADGHLRQLVTMGQARLKTFVVLRRLSEAEAAQRGFLYTGREAHLAPFQEARREVLAALDEQQRLLQQLGATEDLVLQAQMATLVRSRLDALDEVLRLQQQRPDEARERMQSDTGRQQAEQIHLGADRMIAQQNGRMAAGLDAALRALMLSRLGIAAMVLLSLGLLGLFLRQSRAMDQAQAERAMRLRAERDALEAEVARRTAELTDLTRHLETTREDERARLARDLHDELGALLTAAKLDVARIRPSLQKAAPDLLPRLQHLTETLNSGIALKRRIIEDLRPSTLDNLGLQAALEVLGAEFAERLGVQLEVRCRPVPLSASAELTVFRMVQEGLNNIAKHAAARAVAVELGPDGPGWARVCLSDDGRGFDPGAARQAAHGLLGMRYRVEAEGGELTVESAAGHGTRLIARLPQPDGAAPLQPHGQPSL